MSTSTEQVPRVWLAAGIGPDHGEPADHPDLRDDQGRVWHYEPTDGRYHTPDGRHHASFAELHDRTDLVTSGAS